MVMVIITTTSAYVLGVGQKSPYGSRRVYIAGELYVVGRRFFLPDEGRWDSVMK